MELLLALAWSQCAASPAFVPPSQRRIASGTRARSGLLVRTLIYRRILNSFRSDVPSMVNGNAGLQGGLLLDKNSCVAPLAMEIRIDRNTRACAARDDNATCVTEGAVARCIDSNEGDGHRHGQAQTHGARAHKSQFMLHQDSCARQDADRGTRRCDCFAVADERRAVCFFLSFSAATTRELSSSAGKRAALDRHPTALSSGVEPEREVVRNATVSAAVGQWQRPTRGWLSICDACWRLAPWRIRFQELVSRVCAVCASPAQTSTSTSHRHRHNPRLFARPRRLSSSSPPQYVLAECFPRA